VVYVPIGVARTPYRERHGTPQQAHGGGGAGPAQGSLELFSSIVPREALDDLEGIERLWVIAHLHLNTSWNAKVMPPRGPRKKRGLFATRSPHRPNAIGLSAVRLVRVDGFTLHVEEIDLIDGTPILDVKPYVAYADAFPESRVGWIEQIRPGEPQQGKPPRAGLRGTPAADKKAE
jgi:tRNA (adenine37-N6)-methyltransferase